MANDLITVETGSEGYAVVRLNRPQAMNAQMQERARSAGRPNPGDTHLRCSGAAKSLSASGGAQ